MPHRDMAEAVDHAQVRQHPVGNDEVLGSAFGGRACWLIWAEATRWARPTKAEPHSQQSEGTHFHPACSLR